MNLSFEHHYQQKYLELSFQEDTVIRSADDVLAFRQEWLANLSSWHSPYKALIDGSNLSFESSMDPKDVKDALGRMEKLLAGFFLKKAVIFGIDQQYWDLFPFKCVENQEEAFTALGLRQSKQKDSTDFRSAISLQNHFKQHVMELFFERSETIDSTEKVNILKSKITNNLMQWHSPWNLLIDCSQIEVSKDVDEEFQSMVKFFKGFFLKEVIGYSPKEKGLEYPFKVYRSRHAAAGRLEFEGNFSGEEANCQSRK